MTRTTIAYFYLVEVAYTDYVKPMYLCGGSP